MAVLHPYVPTQADGADSTKLRPSNWTAAHTIEAETITYAMMQHISATDKILGRSTAGAGDVEEIACTAAGRALLDDANTAAMLVTLGFSASITELNYCDGVTSAIQTQIDAKSPTISPTFTGTVTTPAIIVSDETASTIASFDASKNIKSLATATYPSLTELSYVKGVTSALQTQLGLKAPLASPTFTGTVVIPTPFTLGAVSVTATGTQLNYLASATGTTGTTSTSVVFSTSPVLITPTLGVAQCTNLNINNFGAILSAATDDIQIRSNYNIETDRHRDTAKSIWAADCGCAADTFAVYRSAPTAGVPSFTQLLLLSNAGVLTVPNVVSSVATGTQPYACTSTTANTNLNADLLDGKHVGTSGNTIPLLDGTNVWSGASNTFNSSLMVKTVNDAAMDATNGTAGEIVFNSADTKFYGCTVSGTPATWAAFH